LFDLRVLIIAQQKRLEFFKVYLATVIDIGFFDQAFNINGHPEVIFDNTDQFIGINVTATIFLAAHSYERV
jgi:hypothetical protein